MNNTLPHFIYTDTDILSLTTASAVVKFKPWCNKLHHIWQSNISKSTKLTFFKACVESILLYRSETWTMKKDLQACLDGTYTRLLMRVQSISWREHQIKTQIYNGMPPISRIVAERRARFAGHCVCAKDQVVSDIINMGLPCPNRGRRPLNYMDIVPRYPTRSWWTDITDGGQGILAARCLFDLGCSRMMMITTSYLREPLFTVLVIELKVE